MKTLPLILSFLPLVAFSLLTRVLPSGDVGVAGLVAALCAAVATVAVRPVWPPKILNVTSLALFTALAVAGFAGSAEHAKVYWGSPTFKKINRVLSAGWGAAIFASGIARVAAAAVERGGSHRVTDLLLGTAIPVVIISYMLKFIRSYPGRVSHTEASAPATS